MLTGKGKWSDKGDGLKAYFELTSGAVMSMDRESLVGRIERMRRPDH